MEYIDIVIQKRFSRVQYWNDGKSPTLEASCGTGGGNVPMVIAHGVTTKKSMVDACKPNDKANALQVSTVCDGDKGQ